MNVSAIARTASPTSSPPRLDLHRPIKCCLCPEQLKLHRVEQFQSTSSNHVWRPCSQRRRQMSLPLRKQVISRAYQLIEDPHHWTTFALARKSSGIACQPESE